MNTRSTTDSFVGQNALKSTGSTKPWLKDQKGNDGTAATTKSSSTVDVRQNAPNGFPPKAKGVFEKPSLKSTSSKVAVAPTLSSVKKTPTAAPVYGKSMLKSPTTTAVRTPDSSTTKSPRSPGKKKPVTTKQWKKNAPSTDFKASSVSKVKGSSMSTDKVVGTPPSKKVEKTSIILDKKRASDSSQAEVLKQSATAQLKDKGLSSRIESLINRIEAAGGFPQRRRLSLRDNDLVTTLERAILNDPGVTVITIDSDPRFAHISKTLLVDFAASLGLNLHLTTLKITGVELDNNFLSALSTSIESNCCLKTIDLSRNGFTSDALVEFCQAMSCNEAIEQVDLRTQISPILTTADELVIESLQKNQSVREFCVDVKSVHVKDAIEKLLARNRNASCSIDTDSRILEALEAHATRSEELYEQQLLASKVLEISSADDWDYLYELSQRANKYQLASTTQDNQDVKMDLNVSSHHDATASMAANRRRTQEMLGPTVNMTSDGAFLTNEFVSAYLVESPETGSLTFAFQTQSKIFKRFPIGDAKRKFISEKFADAILQHPRAKDITHINMANCACGDEWLARLCTRCLEASELLPNLHSLNLETNFISTTGVIALCKCLASPTTWRYLQALKLENQRHLISSRAELELAKALCKNRSVIRFSLRVRNIWERDQINKFVTRNMDYLRQARMHYAKQTGTLVERSRNAMEQLFDRVAANDPTLTDVEVVGNQVFLSLPRDEILKAAGSFATNTHVESMRMTMLRLDDAFASSLANSLEANVTLKVVILESNAIGSEGILSLIRSLGKNSTIVELQLRHQSKPLGSAEEEQIAGLIQNNTTLCKFGVDLRGTLAQTEVDRITARNRELARKLRHENGTGTKASASAKKLPKSQMHVFFEKVANNDSSISSIDLMGDKLFLAMKPADRNAAVRGLSNNTHIKSVRMTMLQLDDEFCVEMASALRSNSTIEKMVLDSNKIGTNGIRALLGALAENSTVTELQLRHQAKPMPTSDEDTLLSLLGDNSTLIKLGIDVRSPKVQRELDHKLSGNRDRQRQLRRSKSLE